MQVEIWLWSLQANNSTLERYHGLLSADERARADRFVKPRDAASFTAGRARLREILGAEIGRDPASLVFKYGPQGKPSLVDGPAFNLSHSGGLAALAIAGTDILGIDIEKIRPVETGVAERFFSSQESRDLATLPPSQWLEGFYRCWTRKEAVIKAVGQGLSMPLDSFDVTLLPDTPAKLSRITGGDARDWQLAHFIPTAGFKGALAVRTNGTSLKLNWRERL
ncbi:4'-phosphopantetheinyl transferase superfamily protein [Falsihalocynthiibacter sp. S25ZX9]|uniref:4'-phosphopantetheinyl transferase family protein n=1 Tax=Falsihalocynthiibacter sp. S25ZX9 TaxID=3240870 RepID=UPI00350F84A8